MSFLLFIFHFIKAMVDSSSSIVIYPLYHLVWEIVAKWGPCLKKETTAVKEIKKKTTTKKKERLIEAANNNQADCNLFWVLAGRSCFHSAIFSD
jgi:hypothetical protein